MALPAAARKDISFARPLSRAVTMPAKSDPLAKIIAEFQRELGGGAPFWSLVEQVVRREFGGATVYITRRPAQVKAARIGAALAQGQSVAAAFRAVGVSRAQGYRLLKRRASYGARFDGPIDAVAKVAVALSTGIRDPEIARDIVEKCLHGTIDEVLNVARPRG